MKPALALALAAGLLAGPVAATPPSHGASQANPAAAVGFFDVRPRVADRRGFGAATIDPSLRNPWGISQPPQGPLWVANNHASNSTVYDRKTYDKLGLTVNIPAAGGGPGGSPTGTVYNPDSDTAFQISSGGVTAGSIFLFVTEDGTISGWNPGVNGGNAVIAVDDSAEGSVYKGVALAQHNGAPRLFVADFANNQVAIYDETFAEIGSFTDPGLPAGYAPFNVQALNNRIYVAFALRNADNDEVAGAGLGYVDVFDTAGNLITQLVSQGRLNAPWGLVIAPKDFGRFGGALLVGNFGDGKINAYDRNTGAYIGRLYDQTGRAVRIEGLWALAPGAHQTLAYSAGPSGEKHGVLGSIEFAH